MPPTDFVAIQSAELEALEAIYGDDAFARVDTRTAWRGAAPSHEFTVRVDPLEDELKSAVSITLHFRRPSPARSASLTIQYRRRTLA